MKLKPYPGYKPSGVEWLGDVPGHWQSVDLRWMSKRFAGGTPDKGNEAYWSDGEIPWLNSGAVNDAYVTEPSALITKEGFANSSAKWIPSGTLVMALAGQGKTKGMVAQLGIRTTCNQSMAAIIPDNRYSARFVYWWLASNYQKIRNLAGGDLRDGLNLELIGSILCPLLDVPEQTAIANFLDRETEKIDRLVAKMRDLIAKLKEKRAALITRAVTRGLDPDAKLKPSGIEWLGDIPEHWEVKKLGHISAVVRGASPRPAGDSRFFDGDYIPWVTVAEVTKDEHMLLLSTRTMLTEEGAMHSRRIAEGTLILTNSGATLGVPKVLGLTCCANDGIVALERLSALASKEYLFYFLGTLTENLRERIKQGSGQPNLNTDIIKALHTPLPPIPEQCAIADYLDRETAKLDQLSTKVEEAITRLQEYRTALITAAVTGKVDVRGVAVAHKPLVYLDPESELRMVAEGVVPVEGTIDVDFGKGTS